MKRDVFVETYSVVALRNAVKEAVEAGKGYPAMVMAYGEAGTGKTLAAQSLYSELGGLYVRAFEGMTLTAFLQDICNVVCKERPNTTNRCRNSLISKLNNKGITLFVDEADRLHVSCMEALRDLHDITGSPVVYIGEMGLPSRVNARSRINDRIPDSFRVHFEGITKSDVAMFAQEAADLMLSPEAAAFIHADTNGNFRRVHNAVLTLERAAKVKGVSEVDSDFVKAAMKQKRERK